jgi:PAS domain S-box-containing protein
MKGLKTKENPVGNLPQNTILESISDGVFTVDPQWRITSFNRAAEEITGTDRETAIGQRCSDVFRSDMCGDFCALRETIRSGKSIIGKSGYIIDAQGILSVLEACEYNRNAAAKRLGIHKTTLFRRIKKLGIVLPGKNGRSRRKKSSK